MRRAWLVLALLPCAGSAEVLVRNCPTSTCVWVAPADATIVQVNRPGAPLVPLADVLPTERIAACYDDPVLTAGAAGTCTKRVPGRSDLWQLKSVLYPTQAAVPSLQIAVDASNPRWDSQAPISSNLLPDLYVRLYGAEQGQTKQLLDAAPWAPTLKFRRESGSAAVFCFVASLALDQTGDKIPDVESSMTAEWCGTHQSPAPVLKLLPPNGITGQAPAP